MTTKELAKLSPEEKRVKIAEACGWKECDINRFQRPPLLLGDMPSFNNGEIVSYLVDQRIPNYPNDLNAMHEAEKRLTQSQCFTYRDTLQAMVIKNTAICSGDFVFGATAAQRADAFLLTVL